MRYGNGKRGKRKKEGERYKDYGNNKGWNERMNQ